MSGEAFNLYRSYVFILGKTENPVSHIQVVVKGSSNETLALLIIGYFVERLIQNEDNLCVLW